MLAKKVKTDSAMTIEPSAKLREVKTVRSRMGSAAVSSRMTKAVRPAMAATMRARIRSESNQSSRSPQSSMSCRRAEPRIIRTMPTTSTRPGRRVWGESNRNTVPMRKPTIPMGRLM